MNPQQAFENAQKMALELTRKAGQSGKEPSSIRIKFPFWQKVRNQYSRRRRKAGFAVLDEFAPPTVFTKTNRANVIGHEEK
uniref:Uncharacterized protein n=1 Tax=Ditylenchus dipsaci TaxID=166011 RepID=A0A915CLN8_9BILA